MWPGHSCLPRRDSSRRFSSGHESGPVVTRHFTPIRRARPSPSRVAAKSVAKSLEAADTSVCATSLIPEIGHTREAVIPLLQAIQSHYRYLPEDALRRICELTQITPAQIAGISSFYGQFRHSPVGKHMVKVCHGTACHVAGARQITEELRRTLAIPEGADTDPSRTFTVEQVACLGCCSLAPVLMVDDHTAGKLTPARACDALEAIAPKEPA